MANLTAREREQLKIVLQDTELADRLADQVDKATGPHGATFVIGAEASDVITVAVQLKDVRGADMAEKSVVTAYLAEDATGDVVEPAATSFAAGTDGTVIGTLTAAASLLVLSEADGDIDLAINNGAGADTLHLVIVLPNGTRVISGAITFA